MSDLTGEQKNLLRGVAKNFSNEQMITIGGFAGTGKTTILKILLDYFYRKGLSFASAAYTGKAANVLRKKGVQADTIHGTIYHPIKDSHGDIKWILSDRYELASKGIDGFVIDEASMVSKDIHEDLMSYNLPIIYVGDHGQLEPIGSKFNLMQNPMYRLETVHRNAGEIAHFAEHLRKGGNSTSFHGRKKVQIVKNSAIEDRHLASVDQIICAFNRTRVKLNERVRIQKNLQFAYIGKGEKIICLRNNKQQGLFNGMQGIVTKIRKNDHFDFVSDGYLFENILYNPDQFGQETNQFEFSQIENPFDYGYAITCHKSQGDEWNKVIVFEQFCNNWDHIRWSYTAASRAKNGLIWVVD